MDLNNDNTLSFEEFKRWMLEGEKGGATSNITSKIQKEAASKITLGEVRRLTGLEHYPLDTIVDMLMEDYVENDSISKDSLNKFSTLLWRDVIPRMRNDNVFVSFLLDSTTCWTRIKIVQCPYRNS